jgi:hypothetical protein
MKTILAGLILGGVLGSQLLAQLPPSGGPRGGFPGFGDPARRTEMLADRLAEDLGLNRDQRKEVKDILDQTQTAAKPLQDELQGTRQALKVAVRAGKPAAELEPLHQQIGVASAKLAALQSAAFAESLKLLKDDQKNDADILYEVLGMIAGSSARPTMPRRGGPGGPDGFRDPGSHAPRGAGGPRPN